MVRNNLDRTVAKESFEYGEHTIAVAITVEYSRLNLTEYAYTRDVYVQAQNDGEVEVENHTWTRLDRPDPALNLYDRLVCWLTGMTGEERLAAKHDPVPAIESQIGRAVKPVLEELDTIYGFLGRTYEIDVEVGMERVRHETSWAEVESEVERISAELGEVPA